MEAENSGKAKGGYARAAKLTPEERKSIAQKAAKERWTGPLDNTMEYKDSSGITMPKVWGKGPVRIYDTELDCYILEDGTAVLNKGKMMKAIGRKWKGASRTDRPNFIGAINLQPFIRPELEEELKGIEFYDGRKIISGYHADILPLVCDVYLDARNAGALTEKQLPIAQKCEMLMRSFARVGIVALIYEQLGFEKYKNPDALRLLIEGYFAEEIRKWSKEFPDELYIHLDRIYGNERTTAKNRPRYYANFTRKYIYDPVEQGLVLKELDKRNPTNDKGYRKSKHHSLLDEAKGLPVLRSMIWQVVGVLKTCSNKRRFENAYAKMMGQPFTPDMFDESA